MPEGETDQEAASGLCLVSQGLQSSGRVPVFRDRVGRDKRNGFSTYQVLCTSVGPTPAPACFQRRATWGRARRGTAKARGEGPGGRVNGSHGLLPFAAPHTRSRHQDWEPAGRPVRSTSFTPTLPPYFKVILPAGQPVIVMLCRGAPPVGVDGGGWECLTVSRRWRRWRCLGVLDGV